MCLEGVLRVMVSAAVVTAAAAVEVVHQNSPHLPSIAAPALFISSPTNARVESGAESNASQVLAPEDTVRGSNKQDSRGPVVGGGGHTGSYRSGNYPDANSQVDGSGIDDDSSLLRSDNRTGNCSSVGDGDDVESGMCEEEEEQGGEIRDKMWRECPGLAKSRLAEEGFRRAVSLGLEQCGRLWCNRVEGSEERRHRGGVYYVVQLGHVAEHEHECLLNISRMIVLHHSWPMCVSDFVCATNHSTFDMSASDCMPWQCWAAETAVLVFMVLVSTCIVTMSVVIMTVIIACPQFHKPKYYLRFSLAATDFLIGVIVCGHAAYNQWVGLTEIPFGRFLEYANLKAGQLFRHVPNCLWGVSDVLTQISGFFVSSNMIISLYTLSLMSLDRYLLLTRTHYRTLVTSRRVGVALLVSWSCGLCVPSLHFVYRPQKQDDICVNYDTSSLDVHIINNESKIATADYKVYLKHAVPLSVTVVVVAFPIIMLLVFSFRTLRKYNSYTRDRSVRQVKSALQLTQSHCSLSRQVSSTSLAAMVALSPLATPDRTHLATARAPPTCCHSSPPSYKLKFIFRKRKPENNDGKMYDAKTAASSLNLAQRLSGGAHGKSSTVHEDYTPSYFPW
uniref:G-protein coupled receptors family 1 profile domain-containing protein n=1 Tax=Scylla olivacea TaxID=85551 RepID=A0A0P4WFC5_SCYOL